MNQREKNYDYLRSISCIAIVLAHVASSYWSVVDRGDSQFVVMTIYNAMTPFAVPVFMMLSGAFLLEKLNLMGITTLSFPCEISIPALTIGIFLCTYLVAVIIKKIPYINRILV